jgi:pre-mRNA-splicing factor SYF1
LEQGGDKLERTRELFEQALQGVPEDKARLLFLMYANFEEVSRSTCAG